MAFAIEDEKKVPYVHDVDVAVAGAGISGLFAALASARNGARTVLIDRFGAPGGNIGPGLIVAGSLTGWPGKPLPMGPSGLIREFLDRHASYGGGSVPPYGGRHLLRDSNIISYVALKMLEESGVELVLSAYAADAIVEGDRIRGLFVETKSGRRAVGAKVVIDATGEADIARRAGAPVRGPDPEVKEKGRIMGMYFVVAGVNWPRHDVAAGVVTRDTGASGDDMAVQDEMYAQAVNRAEEKGEFSNRWEIDNLCTLISFKYPRNEYDRDGFASGYIAVDKPHYVNPGDGTVISKLEAKMRMFCFETARFWKDYIPGFEESYLLTVSPFLGSRGGPGIEGEYTLTERDLAQGRKFDDVIYQYARGKAAREAAMGRPVAWADIPYRIMVAKRIDGLLAVGRSASACPSSLIRGRMSMMHMGQAGGTAAAVAVRSNQTPRQLDVKDLQWALLEDGFYLGDRSRLKELGLV